jgi:hypothetical protein
MSWSADVLCVCVNARARALVRERGPEAKLRYLLVFFNYL